MSYTVSLSLMDTSLERLFNLPFNHYIKIGGHTGCVNALGISSGMGQFIATGSDDLSVIVRDVFNKNISEQVAKLYGHINNILCIKFIPGETVLMSGGLDGAVNLYNFERSRRPISTFGFLGFMPVYSIDVNQKNVNMIGFGKYKSLKLIDRRTSKLIEEVNFGSEISSFCFNPYGTDMIIGGGRGNVERRDMRKLKNALVKFEIGKAHVTGLDYNEDGETIVVSAMRRYPFLYHKDDSKPHGVFYSNQFFHSISMKTFRFGGPDDDFLSAGSNNGRILMWRFREEKYYGESEKLKNIKMELDDAKRSILGLNSFFLIKNKIEEENNNNGSINTERLDVKQSRDTLKVFYTPRVLIGPKSIINCSLIHPVMPLVICTGIENNIYMYSPHQIGGDHKKSEENEEVILSFNSEVEREQRAGRFNNRSNEFEEDYDDEYFFGDDDNYYNFYYDNFLGDWYYLEEYEEDNENSFNGRYRL